MVAFHSLLWVSGLFSLPEPNLSAKSPSIAAAMADFLKPTKTNARGIPEAPFITKVEDVVKAGDDFQSVMRMFLDRLQQYKFMEQSKRQQLADLKVKIPDIEKNLDVIENIKQQKADENTSMEVNYELNDTLYTRAEIDIQKTDSVFLWLGADVMLEYPLDEAVSLLNDRLSNNQQLLKAVEEDLEFLKENITTMEVNTARLFNWDVERRKKEKSEAK